METFFSAYFEIAPRCGFSKRGCMAEKRFICTCHGNIWKRRVSNIPATGIRGWISQKHLKIKDGPVWGVATARCSCWHSCRRRRRGWDPAASSRTTWRSSRCWWSCSTSRSSSTALTFPQETFHKLTRLEERTVVGPAGKIIYRNCRWRELCDHQWYWICEWYPTSFDRIKLDWNR